MFGFGVSFDTKYVLCLVLKYRLILQYVLCVVLRYRLILDKFYITFQGCRLEVFMGIVYKAPVRLTSVFKHCYSPDLEKADFNRQSFNILG